MRRLRARAIVFLFLVCVSACWFAAVNTVQADPGPDRLGKVWRVVEGDKNWTGVWTRRGDSNTFDAVWHGYGQRQTAVLTMTLEGNRVRIVRGAGDVYTGTISEDGLSASGGASWYRPPYTTWYAAIEPMPPPAPVPPPAASSPAASAPTPPEKPDAGSSQLSDKDVAVATAASSLLLSMGILLQVLGQGQVPLINLGNIPLTGGTAPATNVGPGAGLPPGAGGNPLPANLMPGYRDPRTGNIYTAGWGWVDPQKVAAEQERLRRVLEREQGMLQGASGSQKGILEAEVNLVKAKLAAQQSKLSSAEQAMASWKDYKGSLESYVTQTAHTATVQARLGKANDIMYYGTKAVEFANDRAADFAATMAGEVPGAVFKAVFNFGKGVGKGIGEAMAQGGNLIDGAATGAKEGAVDAALGALVDKGIGKVSDLTGGKVPGLYDFSKIPGTNHTRLGYGAGTNMGDLYKTVTGSAPGHVLSNAMKDDVLAAGKSTVQNFIQDQATTPLIKDPVKRALGYKTE